ncbi:hypothetical protein Hamer_G030937 [Homarus americanus]|uniref:Uncharacterized protein n=1 Tax=Homarus americanus TaxID=6706 RepID=A0A8J5JN56_HOMAM|nr:hypothetical protein Hamer_G030937 [Homarus americanus]
MRAATSPPGVPDTGVHPSALDRGRQAAAADAARPDRAAMQVLIRQALNVFIRVTPAPGSQGVGSGDSNGSVTATTSPTAATGHPRHQGHIAHGNGVAEDDQAVTVDDLLTRIKEHLQWQRQVALRRVRFEERRQREGESFDDFYVALKELADDAELCDQCLDARFVTHIKDPGPAN